MFRFPRVESRSLAEPLLAIVAFFAVAIDLDPTDTYEWLPNGPGLTVDESFNVQQGVRLEVGVRYWLLGAVSLRELFGTPEQLGAEAPIGYHLPDHPPLGRYVLGLSHAIVTAIDVPEDWSTPFVYAAARFGSAAVFALTVLLIARFTSNRYQLPAGIAAGISLILMPRVFGHAHLAALETMIGFAYAATVLYVAGRWRPGETITHKSALLAGVLWGLALLTKVQAVLLPVPIALWTLWYWRSRSIRPFVLFGLSGGLIFIGGWPWLWFDLWHHALQYLGRTTDRLSLPVWYWGQRYFDRDVPWHYPLVLFAITVPVGLQVLGLWGVFSRRSRLRSRPDELLLLGAMLFPLLLFALPGVAVYDGERLFLVSFPLWGLFIGKGAGHLWDLLPDRFSPVVRGGMLAVLLATQAWGVLTMRPVYLSYYNLAVSEVSGAEPLGFEPNYWGDSLTADLLSRAADAVPEGGTLAVAPVLHQFQLDALLSQSPRLRNRNVQLVEYDGSKAENATALLVFYRRASLPEDLCDRINNAAPIAEVRRGGVRLAGLFAVQ